MKDIKIMQKCLDKSGPREEKDNQWHIQLPKDKANENFLAREDEGDLEVKPLMQPCNGRWSQ